MNVFYEESGQFKAAAIKVENPGSLQVETASGKRLKIKIANVLINFNESLNNFIELAKAEAETLDVDFLWECCETAEFGFDDLAKAYYGNKPSNMQLAATAIKIHGAPVYFYRKGRGRYKAAPAQTLKQALATIERKRLQSVQMAKWVELLNQKQLPEGFAEKAEYLTYSPDKNSLEWKAIEEAAHTSGRMVLTVMFEAGLIKNVHDYHLGAFLREMFAGGTGFPPHDPIDITELMANLPVADAPAFSIDDATTDEIDDAFSLMALDNGNKRVGIHIAAPALAVQPNTALDKIVLNRLSTVYMPGNKITMLPEEVVRLFSLDAGQARPALSLYCEVAADFAILSYETKIEKINVADNLRHDTLAPLFNAHTLDKDSGHPLWAEMKFLFAFAESLEKARGKHNLEQAPQIDYSFYVVDGHVDIVARERGSPMDKLVAELMIYANSTWGGMLKEAGLSGLYRAQTDGKVFMTTQAAAHQGLGVEQYAWSTSPLRRAVDLINQRQLIAMLQKTDAPYANNDDNLKVIMRDFELTYQSYSAFQRRMEQYWCLQYLIQEELTEISATVWRENLVRLEGMFYITKVSSLPALKTGTRVQLTIQVIDTLLMEVQCKFKQVIDIDTKEIADEVI